MPPDILNTIASILLDFVSYIFGTCNYVQPGKPIGGNAAFSYPPVSRQYHRNGILSCCFASCSIKKFNAVVALLTTWSPIINLLSTCVIRAGSELHVAFKAFRANQRAAARGPRAIMCSLPIHRVH